MKNNYYKPKAHQRFLLKEMLSAAKKLIDGEDQHVQKVLEQREEQEKAFVKYLKEGPKKEPYVEEEPYMEDEPLEYYPDPKEDYFDPDFLQGDALEAYEDECAAAREWGCFDIPQDYDDYDYDDWDICDDCEDQDECEDCDVYKERHESEYSKKRRNFGITWERGSMPERDRSFIELENYCQRLEQYESLLDNRETEETSEDSFTELLPQYTETFTEISFEEYTKVSGSFPEIDYNDKDLKDLNIKKMTSKAKGSHVKDGKFFVVKHRGYVMFLYAQGEELRSMIGDYGMLLPISLDHQVVLDYISDKIVKNTMLNKEESIISNFISYLQFYHVLVGGDLGMGVCNQGNYLTYCDEPFSYSRNTAPPTKVIFHPKGHFSVETIDTTCSSRNILNFSISDSALDDEGYCVSNFLAGRLSCAESVLERVEADIKESLAQLELEKHDINDLRSFSNENWELKRDYAKSLEELSIAKSFYKSTGSFLGEHAVFAQSLFLNMESVEHIFQRTFAKESCQKKILF